MVVPATAVVLPSDVLSAHFAALVLKVPKYIAAGVIEKSRDPGAPVIHDEPDMEGAEDASHNLVHHLKADTGDIEAGIAGADRVFEQTFRVHQVQQTPIEPHIAIAATARKRGLIKARDVLIFHSLQKSWTYLPRTMLN